MNCDGGGPNSISWLLFLIAIVGSVGLTATFAFMVFVTMVLAGIFVPGLGGDTTAIP